MPDGGGAFVALGALSGPSVEIVDLGWYCFANSAPTGVPTWTNSLLEHATHAAFLFVRRQIE